MTAPQPNTERPLSFRAAFARFWQLLRGSRVWWSSVKYGLFDRDYYLASCAEKEARFSAFLHFLLVGDAHGIDPHPLFSSAFYRAKYPDIDPSGMSPFAHYMLRGAAERRLPHPLFDAEFYLQQNPDIARARINPLLHYVAHGGIEGRKAHPLFDPEYYLRSCPKARGSATAPLLHFLKSSGRCGDPHPLFCCEAYLREYPEVAARGINPLVHYVLSEHPGRAATEGSQFDLARVAQGAPCAT